MELANLKLPYCFQVEFNPTEDVVRRLEGWKKDESPATQFVIHNAVVCIALPTLSTFGACYHAALGIAKLAIVAAETSVVLLSGKAIPYIAQSDISVATSGEHFRLALDLSTQIIAEPIFNHTLGRASDTNPYLKALFSKVHNLKNSASRLDQVKCQAITVVAVPVVAIVGALLQPLFIAATLGLYSLTLPLQLSGDRCQRFHRIVNPENAALRVRLIAKSIITAIATPLLSLYKTDKVLEFNEKLNFWIAPPPPALIPIPKALEVKMNLAGKVLKKALRISLYAAGVGLIGYGSFSCVKNITAIIDRLTLNHFYSDKDRALAKFAPDISEFFLKIFGMAGLLVAGHTNFIGSDSSSQVK